MSSGRRLMWGAFALAAAAVVVATREGPDDVPRPAPRVVAAEAPQPVRPSEPAGIATTEPGIVDREAFVADPVCDGDVPAAELERGDASLRLRLVSDTDGRPVEMDVRLWRLDVAESAAWTAGDEIRSTFRVPVEGTTVNRLPVGRYRVECADRRSTSDDPKDFALSARENDVTLVVGDRRTLRQRVLVVGEDGSAIEKSQCISRGGSSGGWIGVCDGEFVHPPSWAHARRQKLGKPDYPFHGYAAGDGVGGGPGSAVTADTGFFAMSPSPYVERGLNGHRSWSREYQAPDRSSVFVSGDDAMGRDTTFVGVAATTASLVAHVVLPDGKPLDPATATIDATCDALRCPWDPPPDAWRSVPVHVKVTVPGYQPLAFDWTAATAGERHVLISESPK